MKEVVLSALIALAAVPSLGAEELGMLVREGPGAKASAAVPPPLRLAESLEVQPMHALGVASAGAADQLLALKNWNQAGQVPLRNGFSRPLPEALQADLTALRGSAKSLLKRGGGWLGKDLQGNAVWGTSIAVANAHRLRLELRDVHLPIGTKLWVWSETEAPVAFDLSLLSADGTLWTPSVAGPTLYLEVATPESSTSEAGFAAGRVLELFPLAESGEALLGPASATKEVTTCLLDAACVGNGTLAGIANLKKGIAYIEFVAGGDGFSCSAGLLNNIRSDGTPYLLTAHHCLSTQTITNTLDVFWDFLDSSCNGSAPALGTLPRSHGGALLSTGTNSDHSLVLLSSAPGTRTFLGWNSSAAATAAGTTLYRLSHPLGLPMGFSQSASWNSAVVCSDVPVARFLYSDPQPELGRGATFGGSSGSPVLLAGGQVVGQLTGACGPNADEPCLATAQDSDLDGRFSQTFPAISSFLSPVADTAPCVQSATTACLQNGRFEARVDWQTATSSGVGQVMGFGGQRAENTESAFYWFFTSTNFEMGLKILNGCGVNNKFWVFISGLTDQGWAVHVRDTSNGATKTYTNALSHLTSTVADTSALSCP